MINELLYLIANRATGFTYPGFLEDRRFRPFPDTDPVAKDIRRILEVNTHDYYLKGYLKAVKAVPDVRTLFGSAEIQNLSLDFEDDFGNLVGLSGPVPHQIWNDDVRKTFPVNFRFEMRRTQTNKIQLRWDDIGVTENYTVSQLADRSDGVHQFRIEHENVPAGVKVESLFGVRGRFEVGDSFWITYHPKAFPYKALSQHLRRHQEVVLKLLEPNLWGERFLTSSDAVERVALVAAALALRPLYA